MEMKVFSVEIGYFLEVEKDFLEGDRPEHVITTKDGKTFVEIIEIDSADNEDCGFDVIFVLKDGSIRRYHEYDRVSVECEKPVS